MKEAARFFKVLADESRLKMLWLLFNRRELCVCDIMAVLEITQSKASRHLRYLRDAGVLEDEREGLIVNYRLPTSQGEELSAIIAMLRNLLANRRIPDAAPLLVQMRDARSENDPPGWENES